MSWPPPVSAVAVIGVVIAASFCDLRTRRLPNALTLGAAGVALALHGITGGWPALVQATLGWAAGVALFVPLYALGGMGAGDVKLLGAIGAWLGPMGAVWTGLYGAIAGGIMALLVALGRGYAGTALRNIRTILVAWFLAGIKPVEGMTLADNTSIRLPYAVPLAAGALATLWMH
jgi:prepilin peptidase CpaA